MRSILFPSITTKDKKLNHWPSTCLLLLLHYGENKKDPGGGFFGTLKLLTSLTPHSPPSSPPDRVSRHGEEQEKSGATRILVLALTVAPVSPHPARL
jgi:hypothetical protein